MKYLTQQAAIIACNSVQEAIRKIEKGIESGGALTHDDSKQSEVAKAYFKKSLEEDKKAVNMLRKLSAELSLRAWEAFKEENGENNERASDN